jgi:hypothetical protein
MWYSNSEANKIEISLWGINAILLVIGIFINTEQYKLMKEAKV